MNFTSTEDVLRQCDGQWESIFNALIGSKLDTAITKDGKSHCSCPVHGGTDGFRLRGRNKKYWRHTGASVCNTCGSFGNGIETLMFVNGWDFKTAINEIKAYLGIDDKYSKHPVIKESAVVTKAIPEESVAAYHARYNRVWSESVSLEHPDAEPARLYLARRGIDIPPPKSLRFHRGLRYYVDDPDGKNGFKLLGTFPAIVMMYSDKKGKPLNIHRIFLTKDGKKAPVPAPKKMMKSHSSFDYNGGAIRLVEPNGSVLCVAEGLETALSVLEAMQLPTWSLVSATFLEMFIPPEGIKQVLVFVDKDRPSKQHPKGHGQEAGFKLVKRLWAMGIKASAITPKGEILEGEKSLDWNDILVRDGINGFPAFQLSSNLKAA